MEAWKVGSFVISLRIALRFKTQLSQAFLLDKTTTDSQSDFDDVVCAETMAIFLHCRYQEEVFFL